MVQQAQVTSLEQHTHHSNHTNIGYITDTNEQQAKLELTVEMQGSSFLL